jgi:hypothetical protein
MTTPSLVNATTLNEWVQYTMVEPILRIVFMGKNLKREMIKIWQGVDMPRDCIAGVNHLRL